MIFKEEYPPLISPWVFYSEWLASDCGGERCLWGYAIIRIREKWVQKRQSFIEEKIAGAPVQLYGRKGQVQQVIDTPEGHFTITFTPKEKKAVLAPHSQQAW